MRTRLNKTFYCIDSLWINTINNRAVDSLATFKVLCHGMLKLLGSLITNEVSLPFDLYLKANEVEVAALQLSLFINVIEK